MIKRLIPVILSFGLGMSAHAESTPLKDWNFLVFVNGVNSLDTYGSMNINQMEQVGSNEKMNIIVEWGSNAFPTGKRMLIQKDNDTQNVTSPVLEEVQNPDFGSPQSLNNFMDWAAQKFPAKHTMIVVWNHGSGWHFTSDVHAQDISYDDRTGNHITTEQLGEVMAHAAQTLGHKVDIYASDACLMGMIEVASEMAASVSYFVGSQDLEPGEGWPYNVFLQKWQAQQSSTAAEISVLLSKEYAGAYTGGIYGNNDATMSVFDLGQIDQYQSSLKKLATELKSLNSSQMAKVKKSASSTKYFYMSDYKDAADFLDNIEKNAVAVKTAADVRSSFSKLVISNDQNLGRTTHGLSIWIPESSSQMNTYAARYKNLAFNKASNWFDFLSQMIK